jgi:hypothetical protein
MIATGKKLTLYKPATYQIKVPGELDINWPDWNGDLTISFDKNFDGSSTTNLIGTFDQAKLQSILRRLYSLGLPLISVICIDCMEGKST